MTSTQPTEFLIAHERWANRNLLTACKGLTRDQFHLRFNMGLGTLHDTTTHILGALRGWGDVLAQRDARARLEEGDRSPEELLDLNEEVMDDISKTIAAHPPAEVVRPERNGQTYAFVRGGVIAHVFTHGFHHRAQCLNMLKTLEVDPLPAVSILEYMMTVEPVTG